MKKIEQDEADYILEKLGQRIVQLYDDSIDAMRSYAQGGNPSLQKTWSRLLDRQHSDSAKQDKLIQITLETLLHNALFCLQEQTDFRVQALTRSGEWINIDAYSDGIHGDLFDWLEKNSKYGCVTNEFVEMRMESHEILGEKSKKE